MLRKIPSSVYYSSAAVPPTSVPSLFLSICTVTAITAPILNATSLVQGNAALIQVPSMSKGELVSCYQTLAHLGV